MRLSTFDFPPSYTACLVEDDGGTVQLKFVCRESEYTPGIPPHMTHNFLTPYTAHLVEDHCDAV